MRITLLTILLIGCAETTPIQPTDTEIPDAATQADTDSGVPDAGTPDSGTDSGTPVPDAGTDAPTPPVDGGMSPDAPAPPSDAPVTPDAPADAPAGPPSAPVGDAADITGSRCALDEDGNFWCWGRWAPVSAVRLIGQDFDQAWGSCALRGDTVWCADFTTTTMIPVVDTGSLTTLAEYSSLEWGCGIDTAGFSVCWTDGGSIERSALGGSTGVSIVVAELRDWVRAYSPNMSVPHSNAAYDLNPDARCWSGTTRIECSRYTGGSRGLPLLTGESMILGFAMTCAHSDGIVECFTATTSSIEYEAPGFVDHAITYPVGDTDPTRPWWNRGICISANTVQCYDRDGALAYTVSW
jgi:hypothetical protein